MPQKKIKHTTANVRMVKANAMTERNGANVLGGLQWHEQYRCGKGYVYRQSGCHDTESLCAGLRNEGKELLLLCGAEVGEMNAMSGCSEMECNEKERNK